MYIALAAGFAREGSVYAGREGILNRGSAINKSSRVSRECKWNQLANVQQKKEDTFIIHHCFLCEDIYTEAFAAVCHGYEHGGLEKGD
jgi:hypothetical protein